MKKIPHFINGQHFDGRSSRYADGFNPATGEQILGVIEACGNAPHARPAPPVIASR